MSFSSFIMLAILSIGLPHQMAVAPSHVKITVTPRVVYIEKGKSAQSLSFDFLIENPTNDTLRLTRLRLSVFDTRGQLVLQTFASSGLAATLGITTEVAPKTTLLLLNPFYSFDSELDLKKLKYEFFFTDSRSGEQEYRSEVIVSPVHFEPKTQLVLPVKGRVVIDSGHDFYAHHRRVDTTNPIVIQLGVKTNPTRYGYDFAVVKGNGALYRGEGKTNEDWYGFGVPIYAPGNGVVREMANDVPDNILGKKMFDFNLVFQNIKSFYGNYLAIDHLNGEYSLLLHLKQGSVQVRVGDKVKQGQTVAQMGISGDADYVHLHYQLQNGLELNNETLPSYFNHFRWVIGSRAIEIRRGQMNTGDIVEAK